ncbi:histone-lysine N-methyltransferase setd3-like protein [Trifolium pratense]|uniref:Histone-lysine N-methyltransferase setd3-like protein n=1 Tax=Trifolium pratense TaxID=57577 RepID=A0A2K3NA99_TRIPR|nr:histone-lysine N-methyltransferase setd3-like protein [Trifolium pratense]
MKLGLKLLHERAKLGSFWWPYISNLPQTYTLPIFFPGEDIKNLQYAPILHQVNKRCRFLLDFEQQVKRALVGLTPDKHPFGGQEVDASSLGWAMSAVSSRAFKLHGNKQSNGIDFDIPMMLPLIDMCNHSFNPNARIVQEQETGSTKMRVVAEKVIKEDDPLLLCYGCLSNDLFLLDYGFMIQSNPYDCIELKYDGALLDAASMAAGVSSPNFSTPAPWQQLILSQLNLAGESPNLKFLNLVITSCYKWLVNFVPIVCRNGLLSDILSSHLPPYGPSAFLPASYVSGILHGMPSHSATPSRINSISSASRNLQAGVEIRTPTPHLYISSTFTPSSCVIGIPQGMPSHPVTPSRINSISSDFH